MTVYNKLKIAIITILSTQTVAAITLDPAEIQSAAGELLYAEMKFQHADPNAQFNVSLAEPEDLVAMGISHQPPGHLNFFTRRSADGSGVIVITSSRPVTDSELNILLKIRNGNATRIQQIRQPFLKQISNKSSNNALTEKPLVPQVIVSEKDIALDLPSSTQYQIPNEELQPSTAANHSSTDKALTVNHLSAENYPTLKIATSISKQSTTEIPVTVGNERSRQPQEQPQVQQAEPKTTPEKKVVQSTIATKKPKNHLQPAPKTTIKASNPSQHVVQANESLWKIATQIAAQTQQSIPQVMQQIQANNQHAFIQGDINKLRQGVALNLAVAQTQPKTSHKKMPSTAQAQSGKEKYKLNQAEMSLVAADQSDQLQHQTTGQIMPHKTSSELSLKIMTNREKTIKLQNNTSQLSVALQQKDQRILLLNTRLAQLQQQLQQQNEKTLKSAVKH